LAAAPGLRRRRRADGPVECARASRDRDLASGGGGPARALPERLRRPAARGSGWTARPDTARGGRAGAGQLSADLDRAGAGAGAISGPAPARRATAGPGEPAARL